MIAEFKKKQVFKIYFILEFRFWKYLIEKYLIECNGYWTFPLLFFSFFLFFCHSYPSSNFLLKRKKEVKREEAATTWPKEKLQKYTYFWLCYTQQLLEVFVDFWLQIQRLLENTFSFAVSFNNLSKKYNFGVFFFPWKDICFLKKYSCFICLIYLGLEV